MVMVFPSPLRMWVLQVLYGCPSPPVDVDPACGCEVWGTACKREVWGTASGGPYHWGGATGPGTGIIYIEIYI